jgi:hypothetical protein
VNAVVSARRDAGSEDESGGENAANAAHARVKKVLRFRGFVGASDG